MNKTIETTFFNIALRSVTLTVFSIFLFASFCFATEYYVSSSSGNDSNSGYTSSESWKTLSKVNSFSFKPGDIIRFKRGDVWKENITVNIDYSGTSDNWITFSDYGTGSLPLLDFSLNGGEGFYIYYRDYIKLENLHIYNAYREGVSVYGKSSDLTQGFEMAGCNIQNNGLRRGSSDFGLDAAYINGLTITDTIFDANRQSGTRIQSCKNVVISGSTAKNHTGGDDHDGFLIQNTDGFKMYNCIANNNSESGLDLGGHEYYLDDMRNAYIYNCYIFDNGDDGIAVSGCQYDDSSPFYTHDIYFYNCLSYNNGTYNIKMYQNAYDIYFFNCLFEDSGSHNIKVDVGAHDITFRNCIVSNSSGDPINIWTDSNYVTPYNLDFDYMVWYPKSPSSKYLGSTYYISDPNFTSPSENIYTLKDNSPAIDNGLNLGEKFQYALAPNADALFDFLTLNQNNYGDAWEIGPYVYEDNFKGISLYAPINLRIIYN